MEIELEVPQYAVLRLTLPLAIDEGASRAKFDSRKRVLTLTMPVSAHMDPTS
mgnify:CR=1 FL=1|jgi:hypothetical protein